MAKQKEEDKCCFCKEIKERMDALVEENKRLKEYESMVAEMQGHINALEAEVARNNWTITDIEKKTKRERLEELVKPFLQPVWSVNSKVEYIVKKCDMCDDNRKRHFTSPLGRHMMEDCECAKRAVIYFLIELYCVRLSEKETYDGDYIYTFDYSIEKYANNDSMMVRQRYNGQDFKEIYESNNSFVFTDYEKAEEYCKWLNERKEKTTNEQH